MDYHIQEFIGFENEAGIFYYRFPGASSGKYFRHCTKIFLHVTGDGTSTVRELLKKNSRAILHLSLLRKTEPLKLALFIPKDELFTLSHYGNHARGALFLDDSE
jgi:hypothetical protein